MSLFLIAGKYLGDFDLSLFAHPTPIPQLHDNVFPVRPSKTDIILINSFLFALY